MAESLDFTRSVNINFRIAEDRLFDAILDFSRSDDGEVDFSGKDIKMVIYDKRRVNILYTLESGVEITILTNRLTFNTTLDNLRPDVHSYRLYNETDNVAIAWGYVMVEWG